MWCFAKCPWNVPLLPTELEQNRKAGSWHYSQFLKSNVRKKQGGSTLSASLPFSAIRDLPRIWDTFLQSSLLRPWSMIRPNINLWALRPQPNPVLEWNDLEFSRLEVILATGYVKGEREEVKFSYSGCWSYYIFQLKSNAVFLKVIIPSACFWLYQKNINIYIKIKIQIENG